MKESIKIEGMMCDGCLRSVNNVLGNLELESKNVTLGNAEVEYDEAKVSHAEIVKAITEVGYQVKEEQTA